MRFLVQKKLIRVIGVVYEAGRHWIALKARFIGPKGPNRPKIQFSAIFSKTVWPVLRFLFQKMLIKVIDGVYEDGCHWIALKARFVGPKGPNIPKIQFSAIFSKTVWPVLRFWFQKMLIKVIDGVYEDGCHWITRKAHFVGLKGPDRPKAECCHGYGYFNSPYLTIGWS